mmetsp:Transcript_35364/g.101702  ORF Transcript_35364/g.101702 Transcript_35364/m.101702 type:complete len:81 (+) Transcript_35364:694-936(+)
MTDHSLPLTRTRESSDIGGFHSHACPMCPKLAQSIGSHRPKAIHEQASSATHSGDDDWLVNTIRMGRTSLVHCASCVLTC